MNKEYDFHPLTMKIKNCFASHADNSFAKRLSSIIAVERVEVFPNEPDDEEVLSYLVRTIIIFHALFFQTAEHGLNAKLTISL